MHDCVWIGVRPLEIKSPLFSNCQNYFKSSPNCLSSKICGQPTSVSKGVVGFPESQKKKKRKKKNANQP